MFLSRGGIHFRLTLLFVALFGFVLVLFSIAQFKAFEDAHQKEFDASLYNYAVDIVNNIDLGVLGDLRLNRNLLKEKEKVFPFSLGKVVLQFRTPNGNVIGRSSHVHGLELPLEPVDLQGITENGGVLRTIQVRNANYRLLTYAVQIHSGENLYLQMAAPLTLVEAQKQSILRFFWTRIPLVLLGASILGFYFSRQALKPVGRIMKKASLIQATSLSERLPVPENKDEIQALAITINELLDRLEKAFQSQERFVADASHQIKTPLTIIKNELETLKKSIQDKAPSIELISTLNSVTQEINHLNSLVTNLLAMARAESGSKQALVLSDIRIDELLLDKVQRLRRLAELRGIKLNFEYAKNSEGLEAANFTARADPELLRSAFHNLIENAIKYSPENSTVDIHLQINGSKIVAKILDRGPGIPTDQKEKVFDRFYRAGDGKVSGAGLGLALAKKIADIHQFELTLLDRPGGGSVFVFQINNV